jgi:hypothetical protein
MRGHDEGRRLTGVVDSGGLSELNAVTEEEVDTGDLVHSSAYNRRNQCIDFTC